MAWVKISEEDSDSNAYDRYQGPEGHAIVYRHQGEIRGNVNGRRYAVPRPPEGNVQQVRIFPMEGGWYVYVWADPRDGRRSEWRERVA